MTLYQIVAMMSVPYALLYLILYDNFESITAQATITSHEARVGSEEL